MAYYAQQQYAPPPGNVIIVAAPTKQPDCLTRTCCCCCVNSSLARRFNNWPLLGKLCCLVPLCVLLAVIIFVVVLLIYLNVGVYSASSAAQSQLASIQSSNSSGLVYSTQGSSYVISPGNFTASTPGMVIIPEFKCDPVAYIPLAVNIAANGYTVVVVAPTLHFPPFSTGSINNVLNAFSSNFAIAGHGVGADTAAAYVSNTGNKNARGLFMMAPFSGPQAPPGGVQTTVVFGDDDGWVSTGQISKIQSSFPSSANFTLITGANHAQFGSFSAGFSGDMSANISAAAQQQQTVAAAVSLLSSIK